MSECDLCIGGGFDNDNEFQAQSWPTARKPHRCCECRETIQPGERYERYVIKSDGRIGAYVTCEPCQHIRDTFSCDGTWEFGVLWEHVEYAFPSLTTGCVAKLTSAAAKAKLVERWNDWKFPPASPGAPKPQ